MKQVLPPLAVAVIIASISAEHECTDFPPEESFFKFMDGFIPLLPLPWNTGLGLRIR